MIQVGFERGLELVGHSLWLDPPRPVPCAFVSHAHSDHVAAHDHSILTEATLRLIRGRVRKRGTHRSVAFGERLEMNDLAMTFLPAGHVFGSAQVFVESARGTLLYTGDFNLRPADFVEPARMCPAETLVMETTYGLPRYRFPDSQAVLAAMVDFAADAIGRGAVPVFFGWSLGKAQRVLCAMGAAGLRPMLHPAVHKVWEIQRELIPGYPEADRFDPDAATGRVLVFPPSSRRSPEILAIRNRRMAMVTGWAMDGAARYRFGCDACFALSDHCDYGDLMKAVELVRPRLVYTVHGFAREFASDLRRLGVEAWALGSANQMELSL